MKAYRFIAFLPVMILCGAASSAFGQPDSLWSQTFGGDTTEHCSSLQCTFDGGYILAGFTESFGAGDWDLWAVKIDESGTRQWNRTLGGAGLDVACSIEQTLDTSYIMSGYSGSLRGPCLVKTSAKGDSLWSHVFDKRRALLVYCPCFSIQVPDGGYVVAGNVDPKIEPDGMKVIENGEVWVEKLDRNGGTVWSRAFDASHGETIHSIARTSDNGCIVAGEIGTTDGLNFWLVRLGENGDLLWTCSFGGSKEDACFSVQQTSDGGYIMAGGTKSLGAGNMDFWLMKTDANGDSLWSRTFGGVNYDLCRYVRQVSDGGYILAGPTASFGAGSTDFWLVRTDVNGDSLWSRTFGGSGSDECVSVQPTADGGYIMAGSTNSFGAGSFDFWLVKTGPDPTLLKRQR